MKTQQFLAHHGIVSNPFADEEAQTDPVFQRHCIDSIYHPTWDKIYGDPTQPATSIVLGEKGSGKTALRMQITRHLAQHNRQHPDARVFSIQYDDFNPFLDRFAETLSTRRRQARRALTEWKLWDHMDAILSLGVTSLNDHLLAHRQPTGPEGNELDPEAVDRLDPHQRRDVLLLAACYDQSLAEPFQRRWHRLRKRLGYPNWTRYWDRAVGVLTGIAVLTVIGYSGNWSWLTSIWPYLIAAAGWLPWAARCWKWHWKARSIVRHVRTGNREVRPLRQVLSCFAGKDLDGQPLPIKRRTDDRYELLAKLQGVLKSLGFSGIVVLVDRVDEPHLITGSDQRMRDLLWPMLDNKFLKQPGIGLKLLLPMELTAFIEREDRDFHQRARLDKQNMVPSLDWSGEALYDVTNARLQACAEPGQKPTLRNLLDESISETRLLEALRSLRVPRNLFKFLYRLIVTHCNAHTDDQPAWVINAETFERELALQNRDQADFDRGMRAQA